MTNEGRQWLERKIARIQSLETYNEERTNESISKQFGLPLSQIVKLNYNENLYLPRDKIVHFLKDIAEESDLRIYPQEEELKLRKEIEKYLDISDECIAIGNSSDDVMDRVIRIFLERGEKAVTFTPTFSVFKYCVRYAGAEFIGLPLADDFAIDLNAMRNAFSSDSRLLYLCSPNNPTATQLKKEEIETLIEEFPGIVLVDEAYVEYADYSVVPLIDKYENLIVLRTFSKAFGLAGLRLGYAVTNPKLAATIGTLPTPYPVNVVSLGMGRKLLENIQIVRDSVERLKNERTRLIWKLNEIEGIQAFDSKANFVLFNAEQSAQDIYLALLKKGLIIKNLGRLLKYKNCLRSTVGLPEMCNRLLESLKDCLGDEK